MNVYKNKVLIGGPVRQDPQILAEFLESLKSMYDDEIAVDYYFIDNNSAQESHDLLNNFSKGESNVIIKIYQDDDHYIKDEKTHYWSDLLIKKISRFKNEIIDYARQNEYDYLLLTDSDLYIHPMTLKQLISCKKDIISEIFWTRWYENSIDLPQVWLMDSYSMVEKSRWDKLSQSEADSRAANFIRMLMNPGVYKVGGLGALTLIGRNALEAKISFDDIYNVSFIGEDRYFCIRAAALGFGLFVDTHYPAFHIYRKEYLEKLKYYKDCIKSSDADHNYILLPGFRRVNLNPNKLTLAMIARNEGHRYLDRVLSAASPVVDNVVAVDDASVDNTEQVFKSHFGDNLYYIKNNERQDEKTLRDQLWQNVLKLNPDWILFLDADEILEKKIESEIKSLINQPYYDIMCFKLYDFWNETQYRDDLYWNAHKRNWPFLLRYQPYTEYKWPDKPMHFGRFPQSSAYLPMGTSDIRIKHMGWSNERDRIIKYHYYMTNDINGKYGSFVQYMSILDQNPVLKDWKE